MISVFILCKQNVYQIETIFQYRKMRLEMWMWYAYQQTLNIFMKAMC